MPMLKVRSAEPLARAEFERRLREWYEGTDEDRIGGDTDYGGSSWLWVRYGSGRYHLNADSKREGVATYLRLLERTPDLNWIVTAGRAGKMTKVVFGARQQAIPGFYLYRKA
jgi:hypothetical protein